MTAYQLKAARFPQAPQCGSRQAPSAASTAGKSGGTRFLSRSKPRRAHDENPRLGPQRAQGLKRGRPRRLSPPNRQSDCRASSWLRNLTAPRPSGRQTLGNGRYLWPHVDPPGATCRARVYWKIRQEFRERKVRQPKKARIHVCFLLEALNGAATVTPTIFGLGINFARVPRWTTARDRL